MSFVQSATASGSGITGALSWGISADYAGLTTTKVSVANKSIKKEIKDKQGNIGYVKYYDQTTEVTIEGYGLSSVLDVGVAASLSGIDAIGTLYITDVQVDLSNEDFVKSTIKAMAWASI